MNPEPHSIDQADHELRWWLVSHAQAGVPELVLIELLRSNAKRIEHHGYIPRTWADPMFSECSEGLDSV